MKTARLVEAWRNCRITVTPWQEIPDKMHELGLTDKEGMEQVWFVADTGRLTGGAAAVNAVLSTIWWAWPFSWLYNLRFMQPIENKIFRWVADNRHRLPGGTPLCTTESNP